MSRLAKILDALTQLFNVSVVSFFVGHKDTNANESTSGRAYRNKWKLEKIIDFFLGKDHCKEAYFNDLERAEEYIKRHRCLDQ